MREGSGGVNELDVRADELRCEMSELRREVKELNV